MLKERHPIFLDEHAKVSTKGAIQEHSHINLDIHGESEGLGIRQVFNDGILEQYEHDQMDVEKARQDKLAQQWGYRDGDNAHIGPHGHALRHLPHHRGTPKGPRPELTEKQEAWLEGNTEERTKRLASQKLWKSLIDATDENGENLQRAVELSVSVWTS